MQASGMKAKLALLALIAAMIQHSRQPTLLAEEPPGVVSLPEQLLVESRIVPPPPHMNVSGDRAKLLDSWSWEKKGFRVEPYGALWADMIYATQRTSPEAFTLLVFSPEDQGESAFNIDTRRTRLGLNVTGPPNGSMTSRGNVEIDFLGTFVTENRANVRLRQAYWETSNDQTRLLVGQTWDVASPLIPSTLNAGFGYFAGNIGFRRAQFRAERDIELAQCLLLTLQGSLNQDIVGDFVETPGVRREAASWPVIEARTAVTFSPPRHDAEPVRLGISGHIGETGFDFLAAGPPPLNLPPQDDARFKTWSFNVDLHVPLSDRFGIQGEYFTGANLSNFLGGIGQGVCPCLRVPIRSTGGWFEVWYDKTARQHFHLGYGVDDPNNKDSLFGRSSNQFIFANFVFDVTQQFVTGLEVSLWRTQYRETRAGQIPPDQLFPSQPGEAVTIDWMVKYSF